MPSSSRVSAFYAKPRGKHELTERIGSGREESAWRVYEAYQIPVSWQDMMIDQSKTTSEYGPGCRCEDSEEKIWRPSARFFHFHHHLVLRAISAASCTLDAASRI
jgi:hypothetical protein